MNGGPEAKRLRQRQIRQLVSSRPLTSQRELVDALAEQGYDVTQATVSRDIAELGLFKAPRGGAHVYVAPQDVAPAVRPSSDERLRRILEDVPITRRAQRADPRADRHARHRERRGPGDRRVDPP